MTKIILLADMESFYASVEIARNLSLRGKPVVVCGDPKLRHGIVLAASKEAKAHGVKTGMAAWECKTLCPEVVFIRPHMQNYIDVSLMITEIFERFTDRAYSIDEQFLDMTGCEKLFGTSKDMALSINRQVLKETGIRCRVGIGENPLQAKMACDRFAKKNEEGIFELDYENYAHYTWPLPIRDLFGVGFRMERNFYRRGVRTIGHLAGMPKQNLKRLWGINGEILWLNSHGIDYSTIHTKSTQERKGVGHSMTLPRDHADEGEIKVVLLEITEEVCRRARMVRRVGKVVGLYCRGADFNNPTGFSRQKKLSEPTAVTMDVYLAVIKLFDTFWDRQPVRAVGISLSQLIDDRYVQLSLLEDKEKKIALSRAVDQVRERFGPTSLFRASSLTPGGQLFNRAARIGGHEA
ncbi:MAG: DNA polymerase IV [Firmicutes bacterium HGW-Firmicutes-13]|nr:MAG: DNA polymerase IV [Firmicutes bacterium HGW-Firmicutes-13]